MTEGFWFNVLPYVDDNDDNCGFCHNRKHPHHCLLLNAGIDFKIRTIELDGKRVKLQIWWVHIVSNSDAHWSIWCCWRELRPGFHISMNYTLLFMSMYSTEQGCGWMWSMVLKTLFHTLVHPHLHVRTDNRYLTKQNSSVEWVIWVETGAFALGVSWWCEVFYV